MMEVVLGVVVEVAVDRFHSRQLQTPSLSPCPRPPACLHPDKSAPTFQYRSARTTRCRSASASPSPSPPGTVALLPSKAASQWPHRSVSRQQEVSADRSLERSV